MGVFLLQSFYTLLRVELTRNFILVTFCTLNWLVLGNIECRFIHRLIESTMGEGASVRPASWGADIDVCKSVVCVTDTKKYYAEELLIVKVLWSCVRGALNWAVLAINRSQTVWEIPHWLIVFSYLSPFLRWVWSFQIFFFQPVRSDSIATINSLDSSPQ